ncbi:pentapeptide repeat-containing protein [Nostoc sp. UCD121]|uniref:pentapeptide repeat-containing protein n=1 Tax=Nostoc sp. UCD121 TaxID=2681305 RepID=UPI001625C5C7|nr:pentapeptide repeat-containing protein [Nostoc sp. UCD121]MBC1281139.1 pentapeptide repeat-containing protein [Nostoc sp. UCD121]
MKNNQVKPQTRFLLWTRKHTKWFTWIIIFVVLIALLLSSTQFAAWLKKQAFIEVLDSLSKLGILIAVITFLFEIPKREERTRLEAESRQFEYWKAIDAARSMSQGDERLFSNALRMALQNLAKERDASGQPLTIRTGVFDGAVLPEIDLANSNLWVCGFVNADLTKSIFRGANLYRVNFRGARLFGADFREANLDGCTFFGAIYDSETLFPENFVLNKAGAHKIAPGVVLEEVTEISRMLWDANLESANLQKANLERAILSGANLQKANLQAANLYKAKAGGLDLRGANLCNANFQEAQLHYAKFEKANLEGADLRGAKRINKEQIQAAKNWEHATYDDEFWEELGVLPDKTVRG